MPDCDLHEIPCSNGKQCVLVESRCNDIAECMDGSDEEGCAESTFFIFIIFHFIVSPLQLTYTWEGGTQPRANLITFSFSSA